MLFGNVASVDSTYTIAEFRSDFKPTDFATRYLLECFISQCSYFLQGKLNKQIVDILNDLTLDKLALVLEKITTRLGNYRYLSLLSVLETTIGECFTSDIKQFSSDQYTVFVRRATVCPSRIVYHFPEPNFSNRVTRMYGEENFMRVRFRDEDFNKLNMSQNFSSMEHLYERILRFLMGGLYLCSVRYEFLAMSSSQLRGKFNFKQILVKKNR